MQAACQVRVECLPKQLLHNAKSVSFQLLLPLYVCMMYVCMYGMNRQAAMRAMMQRKILPAALAIGE